MNEWITGYWPDKAGYYLCWAHKNKMGHCKIAWWARNQERWETNETVTYWMPLLLSSVQPLTVPLGTNKSLDTGDINIYLNKNLATLILIGYLFERVVLMPYQLIIVLSDIKKTLPINLGEKNNKSFLAILLRMGYFVFITISFHY